MIRRCLGLLGCCLATACATPSDPDLTGAVETRRSPVVAGPARVSLSQEASTLGLTVRAIGEGVAGRIVLMNGLEDRPVEPLTFRQTRLDTALQRIAKKTDCAVQECADYYFLFPPSYEALTQVSLTGRLDPVYNRTTASMSFGAGMPLFSVLLWISHAVGITVVADNPVAEARCGEIVLGEVPISVAIEAILKSARVLAFDVESTQDYIFIRSARNKGPRNTLLNPGPLDTRQTALLDTRVNVFLPEPPTDPSQLRIPAGAKPLGEVIESLSRQLGIRVAAERGLDTFPINPAVFNHVPVRTAMDLLIRQWPIAQFGYQMTHDRIVIRRK